MAQPWTPPTGDTWNPLELVKRIGLGRELTFEEGDQNKTSAEDAVNWIGERIMTLIESVAFNTGDTKLTMRTTAPQGWLLVDNRTIGSSSSGANLTGSAYQALYDVLWQSAIDADFLNSSGGATTKGASASADWGAGKRLYLPQIQGRAITVAGQGVGLTNRVLGSRYGSESVNYTPQGSVSQASVAGITATSSTISTSGISATCSAISISSLAAVCAPINISGLIATSSPIDTSTLGINVTVTNGSLNPTGTTVNVGGATCVNAHAGEANSVIRCDSTLVVSLSDIAAGLSSNVGATATLTGSISTPTISIGGAIPTPSITISGSIPTPTISISGTISAPTISIGGSIAQQTFTGTQATVTTLPPSYAVNMIIKV